MNGNVVFATFRSMELMLYISIGWLTVTSLILIRNWFEFKGLHSVKTESTGNSLPFVSICIPARNEEDVIERCVTSALKQNYPNFEVLVLDDDSTDGTTQILEKLSGIIANFHHLKGKPKPNDWLGKPWACHQLSEKAKGEYLVFIDADVWLEENALPNTIMALREKDAITVWPKQHVESFWEQLIIPIVYHGLFTLLPAKYVERAPRWLPKALQGTLTTQFAAACGQFIAFRKSGYEKIGGHKSVKNQIVEDVELAKNLKRKGLSLRMFYGTGMVNCRMYSSHRELWNGLRKNFFAGFGQNTFLFILAALLHLVVFVLPFFVVVSAAVSGDESLLTLSAIPVVMILLQRLLLDFRFRWNPLASILHPLSVLWFQALAVRCLIDYFTLTKPSWKGREV